MNSTRQLPHGWRWVRFGDVVRQVKENTRDPASDGLTRIVGLDDLDSESLPLRRWSELSELPDGTSFTRVFRSGQVLFAKRRAYQRKVAVAHFDGVCSGDILVFESVSDELLAEFLPYLVQSERFFDHALSTSMGSLSPRTKWQQLEGFEFPLPSPADQRTVIEVCQLAVDAVQHLLGVEAALTELFDAVISRHFASLQESGEWVPLTDLADLTMGRQKAPKYEKGINPVPYVRVANMGHLELDFDNLEEMDFDERELDRYALRPGDVLLTEGDIVSPYNVGRSAVVPVDAPLCCFQNTLIRLRPKPGVDPVFLMVMLEGARLSGLLASTAKTTTVTHLGLRRLSEVQLPFGDDAQEEIVTEVASLLEARRRTRHHLQASINLERALRSNLLDGSVRV